MTPWHFCLPLDDLAVFTSPNGDFRLTFQVAATGDAIDFTMEAGEHQIQFDAPSQIIFSMYIQNISIWTII
jgi:hypothetical protein